MTRVLVVDDEEDIRLLARLILEQAGYEVGEAATGIEALARLDEERFDVVILDIRMPEMDGWQVLEVLRLRPAAGRVPVLASSAQVEPGIRARAVAAGCVGFVPKPFSPQEYAGAVANALL